MTNILKVTTNKDNYVFQLTSNNRPLTQTSAGTIPLECHTPTFLNTAPPKGAEDTLTN
jgi:hypothetical protein